jgi:hypothetical protein
MKIRVAAGYVKGMGTLVFQAETYAEQLQVRELADVFKSQGFDPFNWEDIDGFNRGIGIRVPIKEKHETTKQ